MTADERGDYTTVFWILRPLAEQGNAIAQFNLGMIFAKGLGAPQDYREAVKWYGKAAEQGVAFAQSTLGLMFEGGLGVPEDKVLAYALYNLSAAGNASKDNDAHGNRDRLAMRLSRAQLLEGQALTRELIKPGDFGKRLNAWLQQGR